MTERGEKPNDEGDRSGGEDQPLFALHAEGYLEIMHRLPMKPANGED